jgi:UDP-N-acetylmuramoyl-L-alanyl-D-glutamate--2,6-diaminopimelate ligase
MRTGLRAIATTGTNGKTTTTSMVASIVQCSGEVPALVTTVGSRVGKLEMARPAAEVHGWRTAGLHQLAVVEAARAAGVRTIALEVTSLALSRGFAQRWPPDVSIFTNLTRDHLDYHATPEAYLAAKAQLFMRTKPGGVAVLNRDDPASELLKEVIPETVKVWDYSLEDPSATLCARRIETGFGMTRVELADSPISHAPKGAFTLATTGRVHVANALAAALGALAAGYSAEAILAGLASFRTVAGRFECVSAEVAGGHENLPQIVVDYAHTPDGLEKTLETARELVGARRVFCVFGCGGGRDRGKRPMMGAVADRLSDVVVLTSDNPRDEAPEAIAREVLEGVSEPRARWHVELAREAAIAHAIGLAEVGDVVIIAGKGHEEVQHLGSEVRPFSDRQVALEVLRRGP